MKNIAAISLAFMASLVSAQTYNQSAPFALKIANAANTTLNGQYLYACHGGAAIEGLCLTSSLPDPSHYSERFYLNTSGSSTSGSLVFNLPFGGANSTSYESEPLSLFLETSSNVAVPLFYPGYVAGSYLYVGFSATGSMYVAGNAYDDATFKPGVYPVGGPGTGNLEHWYVCWTFAGDEYYQALAWVTSGAPHNPTCEAVTVVKVNL